MSRLRTIRNKEKEYHEECYRNTRLFAQGSWLYKPVATVLEEFNKLNTNEELMVLDLGCGVGRNSIPMAKQLRKEKSTIICVDLLEVAISKLQKYSYEYDVSEKIECICSSIEDFHIQENTYDFIVSVSALEHVSERKVFVEKLKEIAKGTKIGGVNCFIINTNISEVVKSTGLSIEPQLEVNIKTEEMYEVLDKTYEEWFIKRRETKFYSFDIDRSEVEVVLNTHCITYVVERIK